MDTVFATVDELGRVELPESVRRALDLKPGDSVAIHLAGNGIAVRTRTQAIAAAQKLLDRYVPVGVSLADSLIEDRRREGRDG